MGTGADVVPDRCCHARHAGDTCDRGHNDMWEDNVLDRYCCTPLCRRHLRYRPRRHGEWMPSWIEDPALHHAKDARDGGPSARERMPMDRPYERHVLAPVRRHQDALVLRDGLCWDLG